MKREVEREQSAKTDKVYNMRVKGEVGEERRKDKRTNGEAQRKQKCIESLRGRRSAMSKFPLSCFAFTHQSLEHLLSVGAHQLVGQRSGA
jgi:hypothetical protein